MTKPLVEVRRGAYMTIRQLADKAGVALRTVWRIENHKPGQINLTTMKKIADALGVHPTEIAEFADQP